MQQFPDSVPLSQKASDMPSPNNRSSSPRCNGCAWRSLMAAELITYSPSLGQGLGQLLNIGRELSQMSLVITSIVLILVVGIAIELLIFAPIERRILVRRGLTIR